MKKHIFILLFLIAANFFVAHNIESHSKVLSPQDTLDVKPEKYYGEESELIQAIIARYHYKKTPLDDSLSSAIFDRYLKALDYNKSYFLQSEVNDYEKYRTKIDNMLQDGDLTALYEIYNTFRKKVDERTDYSVALLKDEFDFSKDETFEWKRDKADWFKDQKELDEYWRKKVKNDALNLKLTGKDWKAITETLTKRYQVIKKNIDQNKSEDVFQIIMNTYTESIDPHTNYLSPMTSDNFKIDMSRSLEGIGAQLQQEEDYTKVNEVIPGGPAFKSNLIQKGDRIVGVAQEEGDFVDVIGWRLTDVVKLIRGPKGSIVRLQILPVNANNNSRPKEIKLVRDKVTLEEQSAKKDIIEINDNNKGYKIGVITVPAFYSDFEAMQKGVKDYKSTTRDVRKLLKELKDDNIDGLVIDLRNNGGGSLQEAVQLTGLFIKDGPVVQVRNADGTIDENDDNDPNIIYEGPMSVLVNRFSASASEIFSGAIQDYGRGLIIGEQTYGKGTVQNMIDLNRLMRTPEQKLGQVKITIAKYYRINGGSTQNLGVVPDIKYPTALDPEVFGESSEPSALPWDQIRTSKFTPFADLKPLIPELTAKHESRIKNNVEFEYLNDDIEDYHEATAKNSISLNEEQRKKEKDEADEKKFQRENERRKNKGLKLLQKGETPAEDQKASDPMLEETANIIADLIKTIG